MVPCFVVSSSCGCVSLSIYKETNLKDAVIVSSSGFSREDGGRAEINDILAKLISLLIEQSNRSDEHLSLHLKMRLRSSYQILQQFIAIIIIELGTEDEKESVLAS